MGGAVGPRGLSGEYAVKRPVDRKYTSIGADLPVEDCATLPFCRVCSVRGPEGGQSRAHEEDR